MMGVFCFYFCFLSPLQEFTQDSFDLDSNRIAVAAMLIREKEEEVETSWRTFAIILVTDKGGSCQGEEEAVLRSVTF